MELTATLGLAAAHQRAGASQDARDLLECALTVARTAGFRMLEGQALTLLAVNEEGDRAAAHHAAERAGALLREAGHRLGEARALLVLAWLAGRAGRTRVADRHRAAARSLLADLGVPEAAAVFPVLDPPA